MINIIPAIDIIEGHCVRLTRGDYQTKKIYETDPKSVAQRYADVGIKRLHVVDLDGAKAGQLINDEVIKAICSVTLPQAERHPRRVGHRGERPGHGVRQHG